MSPCVRLGIELIDTQYIPGQMFSYIAMVAFAHSRFFFIFYQYLGNYVLFILKNQTQL